MFVFFSLLTELDSVKSFECCYLYVQVTLSSPLLSYCSVIVAIITAAKIISILETM